MNLKNMGYYSGKDIPQFRGRYFDFPVIVCDTETVKGRPYTIQFYNGNNVTLEYVNEQTILDCFLDYLEAHFERNVSIWFFFAPFDLPIIFQQTQEMFCYDQHRVQIGDFEFEFVTDKTWFGGGIYHGQQLYVRDAFQYVFRGLDKVAGDLGFDTSIAKMNRPDWLGERKPKAEEKDYFERYAKQDVIVLWELVRWIKKLHQDFDVTLSVSLADLCGKIFRKRFFQHGDVIKLPSKDITVASLLSYHGGKTECYVDTPCLIQQVSEYDLKSAYPWAMVTMPNFFDYAIQRVSNVTLPEVQEDGLYCVTGNIHCPYRGLYTHDFKFRPYLSQTWVTGYELFQLIQRNEFDGIVHEGYVIESDREVHNPLIEYVNYFFTMKQKAEQEQNKTERFWAKIALNALYGKFIARVINTKEVVEYWKGGVLFNPLMATCVTGKLRGYIHDIEHQLQVYHTSTDAFMTKVTDAESLYEGVNGLGSLVKEYEGSAFIFRKKLYVITESLPIDCLHQKWEQKDSDIVCHGCGKKVLKAALHGFYGTTLELLNMFADRRNWYCVRRMVKLKEARIRRDPDYVPFTMSTQQRRLNIEWEKFQVRA